MTADPLSDVLKTVRLTGSAFFEITGRAPWVAESPPCEMILPKILPGAGHLIAYHVVTEGRCFATIIGEERAIPVDASEVIVFTKGDAHTMSSSPGLRADPLPDGTLEGMNSSRLPFLLTLGSDGPVGAKLVCGYLACDARPFNPLLDNLPRVIKSSDPEGEPGWLSQFIRLATREAAERRAGGEGVLAKLSELMFIEVVRRHLAALPPGQAGWLAGLRDPCVSKALSLIHAEPLRDWTIETLAREAGVSRSVLAERFSRLAGMPPMQYLAQWRMQIATELLSSSNHNMATIAAKAGYASEGAFSRAFKKMVGIPPSVWRNRLRAEA